MMPNVGDSIKVARGYLPDWFDDSWLKVLRFDSGYPIVNFYHETPDHQGGDPSVDINEDSAISPEIIIEVRPA
jgi:hypothetical protein